MKYLLNLIVSFIVFTVFVHTNAQANVCNTGWWQELQQKEDLSQQINDINIDNLYETCHNPDEDTPLMIAAKAGVSTEIIVAILKEIAMDAIKQLFYVRNAYGETFTQMFLEDGYGPDFQFVFGVNLRLETRSISEVPTNSFFATIDMCNDIPWWQQLKPEDVSITNNDINPSQLYETCNQDGDTPLMIAYMAGVREEIIAVIFELAATNAIIELFNARNTHEQTFSKIILGDEYGSEYKLFPNVSVGFGAVNTKQLESLPLR